MFLVNESLFVQMKNISKWSLNNAHNTQVITSAQIKQRLLFPNTDFSSEGQKIQLETPTERRDRSGPNKLTSESF